MLEPATITPRLPLATRIFAPADAFAAGILSPLLATHLKIID
jgi:hypothetical protein